MRIWKAHAAILGANLIYGGNYTIAKLVMPNFIQPFGFIFLRVIIAAAAFFLLHRLASGQKVDRKDLPRMALCGLFGVAINQLFFFKGLDITTPINASLMMITTPVLVFTLSVFFLGEKMGIHRMAGLVLAALGAFLIIGFGKDFSFGSQTWQGDLFIFLNAASYAIYLILAKPLLKQYHPFTVMRWTFFFGMLVVIPVGYEQFSAIEFSTFTLPVWLSVAYVLIATTLLAYSLNTLALKSVNPSVVGIYIYLQPVFATTIAMLAGKDSPDWVKLIASICIFLGVWLVSKRTVKRKQPLPLSQP